MDKKKTSVFFALMYFLSARARTGQADRGVNAQSYDQFPRNFVFVKCANGAGHLNNVIF